MKGYFRAVAMDYDGTLTMTPRPADAVLDRLTAVRSQGWVLALVTGRILAELRTDFPDVDGFFDLIVAENGSVLSRRGVVRDLATPVDMRLGLALAHRDIPVRQGRVLLACDAVHAETALVEITRLGLDVQLVHNREALMVLPAGVTKGTGLREGLAEVGISWHSAVGVGDAENDHSLLAACEVGVAVANAVDSLRGHADVVLHQPAGRGVLELLDGPLLRGEQRVHPDRWRVELGVDDAGRPVSIPGSQLNVLVTGPSGSGKSFAAGLLVEQLMRSSYTILVLDPMGEHTALGDLRGAICFGGREDPLPPPERLPALLRHHFGTVVLDLTMLPGPARDDYVRSVSRRVAAHRDRTGLPHWVMLEEGHVLAAPDGPAVSLLEEGAKGHILVSYRPHEIDEAVAVGIDTAVVTGGTDQAAMEETVAQVSGVPAVTASGLAAALVPGDRGRAVLASPGEPPRAFTLGPRLSDHVRHHHKYADAELPHHLRFFFSSHEGRRGPVAANLTQFQDAVDRVDDRVLQTHSAHHDFSRWIRDVLSDAVLATAIAEIESICHGSDDLAAVRQQLAAVRQQIVAAISSRYPQADRSDDPLL